MEKNLNDIELSVIIVNYKTPQLVIDCLQSIFKNQTSFIYEVIIVDNNSEDNSEQLVKQVFPQIQWFAMNYNSGFARGNNKGIHLAKGKYILVLNSDTIIANDFLEKFVNSYKVKNHSMHLGLLGCRLISMDQQLLVGSGKGFYGLNKIINANPLFIYIRRLLNRPYINKYDATKMHFINHEVDFLSGACILVEKNKVDENLYLDEDFFLYYEDLAWCLEFKNKKYINYFDADLYVSHINAASSVSSSEKRNNQIQISSYLFLRKRYNTLIFILCGVLLWLNFKIDIIFVRKEGKTEQLDRMIKEFNLFKKSFFKVLLSYKRKKSSSQNFLQYVE